MTVNDLLKVQDFSAVVMAEPDREIEGVYIGDLLSWVMGRAKSGDAWITIMSNVNTIAVATLADTACIVLAEGVTLDEEVKSTAEAKGINVISTSLPAYAAALKLSQILNT
ncbi:MAG: DRTGG domain-containing protein [Ruminococcus sp.]|nr:hypothetical protein [Ruminococcus sp.]MDO4419002.1 DRTGG domain-containing protein [Ruminococcus sp.]